jgi:futalosine hydrolase
VKILILAATHHEIQLLKGKLTLIEIFDSRLIRYAYQNIFIDVLESGIGMVAKAYQLGRQLQREKYDLALNIGIAGSFKKELKPGTIVNVVQDQFPEMGAEDGEGFIEITDMGFDEFDSYPFSKGVLINNTDFAQFGLDDLKKVKGITSNTIHGRQESISNIVTKLNPDIETMGGAAFLFACLSGKIPCAQIRSVSNYVEVRNRSGWMVELAVEQLTQKMLDIIDNMAVKIK